MKPSELRRAANYQYEFWDIGEVEPFPTMSKSSIDRVFRSLILCSGTMTDAGIINESQIATAKKQNVLQVLYRIKLPVGAKEIFEQLSGYKCTEPPKISGCT